MHTEDQAKNKFCPMTLSRESGDVYSPCCASGCMAWQWFDDLNEDGTIKLYAYRNPNSSSWKTASAAERRGFCGAFTKTIG